jgi:hypothetical protein
MERVNYLFICLVFTVLETLFQKKKDEIFIIENPRTMYLLR